MIDKMLHYIEEQKLLTAEDKVLVACSGGVDSMVLAHMLFSAGLNIALAHCNFQLRGTDSDQDEQVVRDFGKANNITVYVAKFDTKKISEETEGSLQEVARKLRYDWLESKREEIGFQKIATAHHRNDLVETYLMHIMRGSSYSGFSSIPPQNGSVIRPLLYAEKQQIRNYAADEAIAFREDASNATNVYTRNQVRNELIPMMQKIKPGFEYNIYRQIELFSEINNLVDDFLDQLNVTLVEPVEEGLQIYIDELLDMPYKKLWTSRIARDYGFGAKRVDEIIDLCYSITGKEIQSATHRIIRQHQYLLVTTLSSDPPVPTQFSPLQEEVLYPIHLSLKVLPHPPSNLDEGPLVAYFDLEKLDKELELRAWQAGDRLKPLGLDGSQKVSDLLTQNKSTKLEKEQQTVVVSKGVIIWVIGIRMGRFAAISKNTRKVVRMEWLQD